MSSIQISTVEQFDEIVDNKQPFVLIKHSLTCPISQEAYSEYGKFTEQSAIPCYYLYVQEARPLSNYIAETYEVKHESPQVLFFVDGKVNWHASHWDITEANIKEGLKTAL